MVDRFPVVLRGYDKEKLMLLRRYSGEYEACAADVGQHA